jgi:hypothetical protein
MVNDTLGLFEWGYVHKVHVREHPIQAFEFLEADGKELLRFRPRSHPLGRGCKSARSFRQCDTDAMRYSLSDVDTYRHW